MYSRNEILDGINNYHWWTNTIILHYPEYDSNSIAQYGIEATMPKPEGENNSKVEQSVIRLDKMNRRYSKWLGIIKVINEHQEKLQDEDYALLSYLKLGCSRKKILEDLPINKNYLSDRKIDIAEQIYLLQ